MIIQQQTLFKMCANLKMVFQSPDASFFDDDDFSCATIGDGLTLKLNSDVMNQKLIKNDRNIFVYVNPRQKVSAIITKRILCSFNSKIINHWYNFNRKLNYDSN